MKLTDAHCHLADRRFDDYRGQVLERARAVGIHYFLQGGVDPDDWERQLRFRQEGWLLSFGLHPWFVVRRSERECRAALARLPAYLDRAAALGELGLDHHPQFPSESFEPGRSFFRAADLQIGLEIVDLDETMTWGGS